MTMPQQYAERLSGKAQIVLGLRPEDIRDAQHLPEVDNQMVVSAIVEVVENTGSDLYVHLSAGGGPTFVARFDAGAHIQPGQPLDVLFDTAKMHAFDPETGRSLL